MQLRLLASIAAFAATIPAANWLIGHVGTCVPSGPCVIPVGFGLLAPSGVLMVGLALVLRDLVHELSNWRGALVAIAIGAVLSLLVSPTTVALASASAFLLAELADLAVYQPLRSRRLGLAVVLSGLAGSFVDSAVFLLLAFGSLQFLAGQVVGKFWLSLLAWPVLTLLRRERFAG